MAHSTFPKRLNRFFIVIWAGGLLIATSSLMAGHWVSLPHPKTGSQLRMTKAISQDGVASTFDTDTIAFHFLYGDCPCSRRVLKTLTNREPISGVHERIVLIGEDTNMRSKCKRQGFEVDGVTPADLHDRYGVEAAPLLVVTDREGVIKYSGGYTSRKQGLDIKDVSIIRNTMAGKTVEHLPLYGCATSQRLKNIIDPLNLK